MSVVFKLQKQQTQLQYQKDTSQTWHQFLVCWSFIAPFDVARAAVVHDIMYEKINGALKKGIIESKKEREIYRKLADRMFLEGMLSADPEVPKWKIWSAYYSVRMFGRWAINCSAPRKGI